VRVDPGLRSIDGQTLGYTWSGAVENWHRRAFTSFGDGHGVWETGGGSVLPFYARNLRDVKQWAAAIKPDELMPTIRRLAPEFTTVPGDNPSTRRLGMTADRVQPHGLDITKLLGKGGTGLVWAAVEDGTPIEQAHRSRQPRRASVIQVTNLGVTVKDSPQNTLVFVTRLDNAAPVAGAKVSVITKDNSLFWTGTTGADGVATGPGIPYTERRYNDSEDAWKEHERPNFIVLAEKDGDTAYVANNWNEGIEPWDFGTHLDRRQSEALLRGTVFSDRGVYRLGEEIHFKAILRRNTPRGITLVPEGTPIVVSLRDSQARLVDERVVNQRLEQRAEWRSRFRRRALGNYTVRAVLEADRPNQRPRRRFSRRRARLPAGRQRALGKMVQGSLLVAAYRRPDFRVDVTLKATARSRDPLKGKSRRGTVRRVDGCSTGQVVVYAQPVFDAPSAVRDLFPGDRWEFVGWHQFLNQPSREVSGDETELTKAGTLPLTLTPLRTPASPTCTLEGDVEDVSRQQSQTARASLCTPHRGIGIRRPRSSSNRTPD
jgi:hypothetical protein